MADEFTVHDVQQSDQPGFSATGQVQVMRVINFYIGGHGPFRIAIPKDAATAERINNMIDQEVVLLRTTSGSQ